MKELTNDAIARWLAPWSPDIEKALQKCLFSLDNDELVMDIPSDLLDVVLSNPSIFARPQLTKRVEIRCDGNHFTSIDPRWALAYLKASDDSHILKLLERQDIPLTVVRMVDNKILFANQPVIVTGTSANDMLGKNSRDWWIDDQYTRFIEKLTQCGSVREHGYKALLMKDGQPANFTVNASITRWRGDDVRVVEVLDIEPI